MKNVALLVVVVPLVFLLPFGAQAKPSGPAAPSQAGATKPGPGSAAGRPAQTVLVDGFGALGSVWIVSGARGGFEIALPPEQNACGDEEPPAEIKGGLPVTIDVLGGLSGVFAPVTGSTITGVFDPTSGWDLVGSLAEKDVADDCAALANLNTVEAHIAQLDADVARMQGDLASCEGEVRQVVCETEALLEQQGDSGRPPTAAQNVCPTFGGAGPELGNMLTGFGCAQCRDALDHIETDVDQIALRVAECEGALQRLQTQREDLRAGDGYQAACVSRLLDQEVAVVARAIADAEASAERIADLEPACEWSALQQNCGSCDETGSIMADRLVGWEPHAPAALAGLVGSFHSAAAAASSPSERGKLRAIASRLAGAPSGEVVHVVAPARVAVKTRWVALRNPAAMPGTVPDAVVITLLPDPDATLGTEDLRLLHEGYRLFRDTLVPNSDVVLVPGL